MNAALNIIQELTKLKGRGLKDEIIDGVIARIVTSEKFFIDCPFHALVDFAWPKNKGTVFYKEALGDEDVSRMPYSISFWQGKREAQIGGSYGVAYLIEDNVEESIRSIVPFFKLPHRPWAPSPFYALVLIGNVSIPVHADVEAGAEAFGDLYGFDHVRDFTNKEIDGYIEMARQGILDMIAILRLMYCKNVHPVRVTVSEHDRQFREKKNLLPLFEHYTLRVTKPGHKTITEGKTLRQALFGDKREHKVTGSWANYTKGGLLFGKLYGRFFRPDCTRGNPKKGVIHKDYEIQVRTDRLE